jgi:hypothetical protein
MSYKIQSTGISEHYWTKFVRNTTEIVEAIAKCLSFQANAHETRVSYNRYKTAITTQERLTASCNTQY